jgi:general stress protein 26
MAEEERPVREIWQHFRPMQTAALATVDGDAPRVRPVALIHHDHKLWVSTGTTDNKVKQILLNPNVEFYFLVGDDPKDAGYVRGFGQAEIVEDEATRVELARAMPFFSTFWTDASDPNFTLLRLRVSALEYMKPGETTARRIRLED